MKEKIFTATTVVLGTTTARETVLFYFRHPSSTAVLPADDLADYAWHNILEMKEILIFLKFRFS